MTHVTYPLSSTDITFFHWKSANFATDIDTDVIIQIQVVF